MGMRWWYKGHSSVVQVRNVVGKRLTIAVWSIIDVWRFTHTHAESIDAALPQKGKVTMNVVAGKIRFSTSTTYICAGRWVLHPMKGFGRHQSMVWQLAESTCKVTQWASILFLKSHCDGQNWHKKCSQKCSQARGFVPTKADKCGLLAL